MTDDVAINPDSARSQYYFRALICIAAAGTLASFNSFDPVNYLRLGTMAFIFIYVYVAYRLIQRAPEERQQLVATRLGHMDAGLIGFVLGLADFSLLPCALFVTMIQFNALLHGGGKKWALDNAALCVGIFVSLIVHNPRWVLATQLEISISSLIGLSTYFCVSAWYTYAQISDLRRRHQKSVQETINYKVKAYKLSRYISPTVWAAINEDKDKSLQTDRKRLTVFFSDIKDFSQLSEELEAETLTGLLNTYLSEMSKIVSQYGGTIDKFIGDGLMVIFGDFNSQGIKNDSIRCVSMAIAMRKRMKSLQREWVNQGVERPLEIRMGINTGYCTVGTFGTSHHLDYTVLGTHVNLASRLESAAAPGEILLSHETWSLCRDTIMCRCKGEISVKGFSHPIKVYQVMGLRKDMGVNNNFFEHNLDGFSIHLDTDKVRNYDRDKAIKLLEDAAKALKQKF
ncbi:MAG: adenylate/guanylate cyclase domain-containing protein [Gammaproteobacteria bacterium]|uniref:adenylate/guanylate cyclase domain-containing protein n=1 Tax=Pseudomaricurvus alcaniphilus TaxID=1166482 RepID=UPI00140B0380|nr:adenylate/guanylate cyclase domain-containing protein [Pseudomaricurvus alcaniphilus]MBR9913107.1 adenylate/guanylate cyclase domain-containing protein [Gammaproteobacteria bacterium]NHN36260.1 adenylate/guanylate cyclase domain-containing protein [Pseudomaricurvus alcaniphilus]